MAWIAITESELLTVLSAPELEGYREAALADAQPDPVEPTIAQVVDLVRGYVAACSRNLLGAEGTIPSKLIAPAIDLIAVRVPGRVGKSPKPGRKDAGEAAIKLLEQVAACKYALEEPTVPSEEQASVSVGKPSFSGRARRDVRRESDGL